MGTNVEEVLAELDVDERRAVEQMSAELIAEELTLRDFRTARQLARVSVARALGVTLDGVSQLEQQTDILLSTLRRTVEAMGGRLMLIATFPGRSPVRLSGISEQDSGD